MGNRIFTLNERTQLYAKVLKNFNKLGNYLSVEWGRESKRSKGKPTSIVYVHIPIAYLCWYFDIDHVKSITPEDAYKADSKSVVDINELVQMIHKYTLHLAPD